MTINATFQRDPRQEKLVQTLQGWNSIGSSPPYVIGVLHGEGIGPEIINSGLLILRAIESCTDHRFDVRYGGKIGQEALRETGQALTPDVMRFCQSIFADGGAVFCGPGGGRFVYELRRRFDLYCKMAPLKPMSALRDTGALRPEAVEAVDVLIIRENTGGMYLGEFGFEQHTGRRRAYHRFHYDEEDVARILRVAFNAARMRRGRLCVAIKPEGVPSASQLWRQQAEKLATGGGVELQLLDIDTACYQLVAHAKDFDVIVAPNMFGDVLADGATVLLGSRGMSYSGNFADNGVAVYQTGHGAAHDLAGMDRANPVGQIQSLSMMLRENFGLCDISALIQAAINDVLSAGWRTRDIMAPGHREIGTRELCQRIAEELQGRLTATHPRTETRVIAEAIG